MSRDNEKRHDFEEALDDFVGSFELVFDNDWEITKARIRDGDYISTDGTFIEPKVEDESNNWGNRGALLTSYRRLRRLMDEYGFDVSLWDND
jgi:hypothetical protein